MNDLIFKYRFNYASNAGSTGKKKQPPCSQLMRKRKKRACHVHKGENYAQV